MKLQKNDIIRVSWKSDSYVTIVTTHNTIKCINPDKNGVCVKRKIICVKNNGGF